MRKKVSVSHYLMLQSCYLVILIVDFIFFIKHKNSTMWMQGISLLILVASLLISLLCICRIRNLKKEILLTINGKQRTEKSLEYLLKILIQQSTEAIDKEITATIANTRAEISALQSQINPHFLYNTLDAIRGQALIDGTVAVADMAEALSHIFRYSISNPDQLVTLQTEMRNVGQYMMIQKFRFDDKFKINVEYEDDELIYCYIPKLTLQPIIENAIYHGLETVKEGGIIEIYVYATEKHLVISVQDNGKGMTEKQLIQVNNSLRYQFSIIKTHGNRHTGVGLSNIQQRIGLLFGKEYGLVVRSALNQGTQIEIILPLITDSEELSWKQEGNL